MANPTSNFLWQMPTPTDLVTDLPADFEVFGQAVDTSLADLKGGTSGQVLAKNSNTDMDFVWVAQDDSNAIQNAIVDAKGDLIAASANDTPARLAVGNNGETLVADSSTTTGLRYQGNYAAGKNKIINGDFGIWQRGTSFSSPSSASYTSDRWRTVFDGTGATRTISQQTFTPGTAPVSGYEGQFFYRIDQTVAGSGGTFIDARQRIEDVRTFAGQPVTISFWAKAAATQSISIVVDQDFGSGGSSKVFNAITGSTFNISTAWTRYTLSGNVASVSGKTIGTSSFFEFIIRINSSSTFTVDLWGVQVEYGSVATAFQTATGTLQGELAACQRYYEKSYAQGTAPGTANIWGNASISGLSSLAASTAGNVYGGNTLQFKVTKRTTPTMVLYEYGGTANAVRIYPSDTIRGGVTATPGVTDTGGGYISVDSSSASAITTNYSVNFSWTASAEL
jgi:hypothetical protein